MPSKKEITGKAGQWGILHWLVWVLGSGEREERDLSDVKPTKVGVLPREGTGGLETTSSQSVTAFPAGADRDGCECI